MINSRFLNVVAATLFCWMGVSAANMYDVKLQSVSVSGFAEIGKPYPVTVSLMNRGLDYASTVEIECTVEGEEPYTETVKLDRAIGQAGTSTVTAGNFVCNTLGEDIPLKVRITKVNDNADQDMSDNTGSTKFSCIATTYPQNVVIEEWTGTWCQYCVRGIVGMEYMTENYGADDSFIGIAVHGKNGDPMITGSYAGFLAKYEGAGYPGFVGNRKMTNSLSSPASMEVVYNALRASRAMAKIDLVAWHEEDDPQNVGLCADAVFGLDKEYAKYRIAFVLVEDSVGPYVQTNGYAWGAKGEMGGWEKLGRDVPWTFNEVAREAYRWDGIPNSLPSAIKSLTPYRYRDKISAEKVKNLANCTAVAMIIDATNGQIVNATKTRILEGRPEGVDDSLDPPGSADPDDPDNPEDPSGQDDPEQNGVDAPYACNAQASAGRGFICLDGDVCAYTVYSADGRIVASGASTGSVYVPAGLYIVELHDSADNALSRKLIVR